MFAKRKTSNWATGGMVVAALVVVNGIGFLAYRSVTAGRVSKSEPAPTTNVMPSTPVSPPAAQPASAPTTAAAAPANAPAASPTVEPIPEASGSAAVPTVADQASAAPTKEPSHVVPKGHRPPPRHVAPTKPTTTGKEQTPPPKKDDDDFILESNPYTHNK